MIKLHLGCGHRNFGQDWIHIDGGVYEHIEHHNITKLDYKSNSVDLIYASHVLEYFDREEVILVLKEWYRVLKPKGTLRLAVPDFYTMTKLYLDGRCVLEELLGPVYGKMTMGDKTIYHKTTYDFKSLVDLLKDKIGFINVIRYDWRQTEHAQFDDHSQAYKPNMDKENGTLISLNIEVTK
jgi:predicted SAM-dependent methyltransferase